MPRHPIPCSLFLLLLPFLGAACGDGPAPDPCRDVVCGAHGRCDPATATCACDPGYEGAACAACAAGFEAAGETCACPGGTRRLGLACYPEGCALAQGPALGLAPPGALLSFHAPDGVNLQLGSSLDPLAPAPDEWISGHQLTLPAEAPVTVHVFARDADPACADGPWYSQVIQVRAAFPGPAGEADSEAIEKDSPALIGWASAVVEPVAFGEAVIDPWRDPAQALGPAEGTSEAVVSLGRGGSITLRFDPPIADGPGPDLAVFENGFADDFLDLAWVEVSSDGVHFLRFAGVSLGLDPLDAFGTLDTRRIAGLVGKYRRGFGQPCDLSVLAAQEAALDGRVDLSRISHVRIVDLVGDGREKDAFGQPIYDPYPTAESAGFDLDAVGVLNQGF